MKTKYSSGGMIKIYIYYLVMNVESQLSVSWGLDYGQGIIVLFFLSAMMLYVEFVEN